MCGLRQQISQREGMTEYDDDISQKSVRLISQMGLKIRVSNNLQAINKIKMEQMESYFPSYIQSAQQIPVKKVLLKSKMLLKLRLSWRQVWLILTPSYLFIKFKHTQEPPDCELLKVRLHFDISFTLLRQQTSQQSQSKVTRPIGLKIQRTPQQGCLQFHSGCSEDLAKWKDQLCKLINRRSPKGILNVADQVGSGHSSRVYKAYHRELAKHVAVKVLAKQTQKKCADAIVNQIAIMRRLNHQNLIRLHEVYQTSSKYLIVTQLLEGGHLGSCGRIDLYRTRSVLIDVAKGLARLWTLGILHRDLKPQNILFRNKNCTQAVIIDFGLATYVKQKDYIYVRCGTPGYVSPQILNYQNGPQQLLSDMYSFGAVAHYLALGQGPFPSKSNKQVLQLNRKGYIDFNKPLYKDIDLNLLAVLKSCLSINQASRPSPQEVLKMQFFTSNIIQPSTSNSWVLQNSTWEQSGNKQGKGTTNKHKMVAIEELKSISLDSREIPSKRRAVPTILSQQPPSRKLLKQSALL